MKLPPLCLILLFAQCAYGQLPKVVAVKEFTAAYPSSSSLGIPFHGCVVLDGPLPEGNVEFWLPVGHLTKDEDFSDLEILVNADKTILGARATFKGDREQWKGARGYAARLRVLDVFNGGDGTPLPETLPLAFDGDGFGDMVYTFDLTGHVSWRLPQNTEVEKESDYVSRMEAHKATCEECKNISFQPRIILPQVENGGGKIGSVDEPKHEP